MTEGIGWIVEAEVRGYFDRLDKTRLRDSLRKRVNEGRIRRRIGKWLRAGGMEAGVLTSPETGVPQGGVVAPVLANICLPHVLDEWVEHEVRPRRQGRGFLPRFADDCVMGCAKEADARKLMDVLPKRVARFGLTMHPTKTALLACPKPGAHGASTVANGTFDFRGLPPYGATSRRGGWVSKRRTARKRRRRTKKSLWHWCRTHRPPPRQYPYQMLCLKLRGHCRYDGIRGHFRLLEEVRKTAEKAWQYWLRRRSNTSAIKWEKFARLLETYGLPTPKLIHNISRVLQGSKRDAPASCP